MPVTITPIGSATGVPSSIAAQLSYGVTTPTGTNTTVVPIYVYDANPDDCTVPPPQPPTNNICLSCGGSGGGGGGGGGGGTVTIPSQPGVSPPSVEVQIKLKIEQSAVIARDGFKATLELTDNAGATVSNVTANITVYDASNNVANSLFGIPAPAVAGSLNAVDGTGVLAAGASGTAAWTIVPTLNAAPTNTTAYTVGGYFSYVLNGEPVTVPLFPVAIQVLPVPVLAVDCFLQHDVYGDDPFTPQIEPSIPFALGIRVKNTGYGSANDFTITSGQPQIIENQNDLLIAFQLISSQAATTPSPSPSFTLDFGDLGPLATASGLWYLTSTLEGQFIDFSATYMHLDSFGNTNTSIISRVTTHQMNHVVRITEPMDDGQPDFLVNDSTNLDALPDIVYSSDGTTAPVTSSTAGVAVGAPSSGNLSITLTVPPTTGYGYFEVVDPGNGNYPIASVTRSDGINLLVGPNVWQTPERIHMVPSQPNNLIHIFDADSTGSYTITYSPPPAPAKLATPLSLVSSENPSGYKDAVSFSAETATTATGNVLFLTNGVVFDTETLAGTGIATSMPLATLPRGTNTITAAYAGDSNYVGSTNTLDQVVTNHPPVAGVYTLSRTPGTKLHILWSAVSSVWSDPDGDALSVAWVSLVSTNGITVQTNSQQVLYSNPANVGDQFAYAITDGYGGSATNVINISVNPFTTVSTGRSTAAPSVRNGSTTVSFYGIIGFTYEIQRTIDLVNWVNISTNTVGPGGIITFTDTFSDLSGPPASAYYRLAWHP